jgi:hypothetical protein
MMNNEIPDDQLDRLKSQWEQRWKSNLARREEEAKQKRNDRDMLVNQMNEQQQQADLDNIMMQQQQTMQLYGNGMGPRHMPVPYQQYAQRGYHQPQYQGGL